MATLTTTVTESVTLNGATRGTTNTLTTTGIVDVFERILTCSHSQTTTIAIFESTPHSAAGALDVENCKYIRVTNLDSSNPVNLNFQIDAGEDDSAADESSTLLLAAGQIFSMGNADDCMSVDDDAATPDVTLHPLESIIVDSGSNAVQLELLIASV